MLCAFVLSSVGSARTCPWARAVINWSPRYPHTPGVTSLPQAREAEWVGLRALPAAKSHPSLLLHVAMVVYGGFIHLQIRDVEFLPTGDFSCIIGVGVGNRS